MADLGIFGQQKSINDYLRAEEEFNLRKQIAMRSAKGSKPAAVQIAEEAERRMNAGDMDGYYRLMDVAKVYDKGIRVNPVGGQMETIGQPSAVNPISTSAKTPNTPPMNEQERNQAIIELYGSEPSAPVDLYGANESVQVVPGYDEALARREAIKKGAGQQATKNVDLRMNPQIERETNRAGAIGKSQGEEYVELTSRASRMPQLIGVTDRLSALGKLATYTYGGQARDFLARQAGIDVPDSAVARAEYISIVDNEVLPLLRETFGAQFTQQEGQSLKVTLGDPNKSPEEKDAVLRSFLQTKMETINTQARKLGMEPPYKSEDIQSAVEKIGVDSAKQEKKSNQVSASEMRFNLKKAGYSEAQIEQFLKAKGY